MKFSPGNIAIVAALLLQGCGTLIPGPRRQVYVRNYGFSHDGSKVLYQEERYSYRMLSEKSRSRLYVYMYDVKTRKHRKIARSAVMEVSPDSPTVLLGGDWHRENTDDLYVFDYSQNAMNPVNVSDAPDNYPFMLIQSIDWLSDGDIVADVVFSATNPCEWVNNKNNPPRSKILKRPMIIEAMDARITERRDEIDKKKPRLLHSPDGRFLLGEEPYEKYFMFHTSLYLEDPAEEKRLYITKDSHLRSMIEGVGYMGKYIFFGILKGIGL